MFPTGTEPNEPTLLPSGMTGDGVDEDARDAARSAATAASNAQAELDEHEASTHNHDTVARDAARSAGHGGE